MSAEPIGVATTSTRRDLSAPLVCEECWLARIQGVLELAESKELPLLERVRFLAAFATDLDEFFSTRVAGLKRRLVSGVDTAGPDAEFLRPRLELTSQIAHQLTLRQSLVFRGDLRIALDAEGIQFLRWDDLSMTEKSRMRAFFRTRVWPLLTPLAVGPTHPFPRVSGLTLNLAVTVRDPTTGRRAFTLVGVPASQPRFLEASRHRYLPTEEVISAHLDQIFVDLEIVERHVFRVTRDQAVSLDNGAASLLASAARGPDRPALEPEGPCRRFGSAVRLEVEDTITDETLRFLAAPLAVEEIDVYRILGPLDLSSLHETLRGSPSRVSRPPSAGNRAG